MARTPSNMVPLGSTAPDFQLPDTISGKMLSLGEVRGDKGTVIMFICNHCPFVKHVNTEIVHLARTYQNQGIGFVAISSNDVENYPEDHPDKMKETGDQQGYCFPYLYDKTQQTALAYDAACTPDFYLYDASLKLIYRGQLDDSRPGNNIPLSGKDLEEALVCLLEGRPVHPEQKPSVGCNIKWKKTS